MPHNPSRGAISHVEYSTDLGRDYKNEQLSWLSNNNNRRQWKKFVKNVEQGQIMEKKFC